MSREQAHNVFFLNYKAFLGVFKMKSLLSLKEMILSKDLLSDECCIFTMYSKHKDGRSLEPLERDYLDKIYHLRYDVYCSELKFKSPYCDEIKQTIIDPLDNNAVHIFITKGKEVVGCARLNFSEISDLGDFEDLLCMKNCINHPSGTCLATKLMIKTQYRGKLLDLKIIDSIATLVCSFNVTRVFLDCRLDLENYYKKIGLIRCGESFDHYETGKVVPMMIDLLNLKHLQEVRSPLSKNEAVMNLNDHIDQTL